MSLQHVANVPQDLRAPVAMQQVDLLHATSLSDLDNLRQSHLHQIFITSDMPPQRSALTRACTRDLGSCHHGHLLVHSVRWCPSTISLWFFLILSDSLYVTFCSFLFHTKPWFVDLVDQLSSAAHDSSALAMVLAENRHLNCVDFTSSCRGLKSWRHQEGTPRDSKFTCHIHLHPEEVPKYSKPVAADSKPCRAK